MPREVEERRFLVRWMALGLLLILVAAFRSVGFHNADEHFQVLEFASAKLGRTPWSALPWEYTFRMRPWLQPALYTLGARSLAALGVEDPFAWALGFRLFSGLMAWLGLVGLAVCSGRWIAEPLARRLAIRALVLSYFVPYLAVRTSAESLSTSCVVLALCLIGLGGHLATPGVAFLTGVLLGLAAGLRYATAVAVVSTLAWLLLVGRAPARRLGWIFLGIASALALALAVDRWGYGEWTLAAWNYVFRNFGEGRAALEFGALPWYGYLFLLSRGPFAPLNLLLAGFVVVAWVRHPRHLLTWATAPLVLVHCAIAHKELRFLFPVAMLSPLLLGLAVGGVPWRRWARVLAGVAVALDLVGLAALCILPARPQVAFLRFVTRRFPTGLEAFLADARLAMGPGQVDPVFLRPAATRPPEVARGCRPRRLGRGGAESRRGVLGRAAGDRSLRLPRRLSLRPRVALAPRLARGRQEADRGVGPLPLQDRHPLAAGVGGSAVKARCRRGRSSLDED